jgi:4-amino-4-deoxy-L-arabinose transferase-like glycosyltransferase
MALERIVSQHSDYALPCNVDHAFPIMPGMVPVQLPEQHESTIVQPAEPVLVGESSARESRSGGVSDRVLPLERIIAEESGGPRREGLRLKSLAALTVALVLLVPTVGDFGLSWDEPAYRYSQLLSAQWWEQLGRARSWHEIQELMDPLTLLYYWPYARHGINFHPPLAGQLNLATYAIFGNWMKDIPARRMASVIEFAACVVLGFHFLARRYGGWVGLVAAGSLLLIPRLYGQAHLVDTDTPGLLLWAATAMAFWNGLHEPSARGWRVAVGILLGLAFIEKMGAVVVLLPILLWLVLGHLPRSFSRTGGRADWIDGIVTTGAMLIPLWLAFQQIQMLQRQFPPPAMTNLFIHRPYSDLPGAVLVIPLLVWCVRRLLARMLPKHGIWGVERPALGTWTAILAFAPVVGWLGNPAWWRETLPRLTHYYTLSFQRQGSLPDIQILYFGQAYEFSLPWPNAWVLMAISVPVAILCAAMVGLVWAMGQIPRDRLPFYFFVHFMTLPVIRMLDTPAHDGVRLFLPTFFFLAAFAGWGAIWLADLLARGLRLPSRLARSVITAAVLGSAALALFRIHPYELSYYNELIGGPRGAWERGFELTYWYDAFNPRVISEINSKLPLHAEVDFLNDKTNPVTFQELQMLGALRADIVLIARDHEKFPYVWLLTQDSKASAFTRLLFAMHPWYASAPVQLEGARVATVADPVAVSRAWALQLLLDTADRSPREPAAAPRWVSKYVPWLGRFWGDGLVKVKPLAVNQKILDWSRVDPNGLLAAARILAANRAPQGDRGARRLMELIGDPNPKSMRARQVEILLSARPEALPEAVGILQAQGDEVVKIMTRYGYTDPEQLGGYLDRDFPAPQG